MKRPTKTLDYTNLRGQLDAAPQDRWEDILTDAIEQPTSEEEELQGSGIRCSVSDVEVGDTSIHAEVRFFGIGEAFPDDDGPYQDEDGNPYDQHEIEASYFLTVTATETKWEDC